MADKKIPSPQSIAQEPQKFSQDELDSLRDFQIKMDRTIMQLGRINLSQIKLKRQEKIIKNQLEELEKEEQDLAKSLSDKYGKGSLDIDTGTFTPTE